LGLEAKYNYTPRMYRRIVFASAQAVSFRDAAEALWELGELPLLPKRMWRAAIRIGEERVAERRAAAAEYQQLTLPAQRQSPAEQVPQVACVQMDGGRYQLRERTPAEADDLAPDVTPDVAPDVAPDELDPAAAQRTCWREYKAGLLLSMTSQTHATDPCPQLPETFLNSEKMREIVREIKGFTTESPVTMKTAVNAVDEAAGPVYQERIGRPETLVKSLVATRKTIHSFGPLLAQAAYERGFHAAARKAFVADGAAANWSVWEKFFSHYTGILDFIHALMYVYAAAMAGRTPNAGWLHYRDWAQWLWSGDIDRLLAALQERQAELGIPEKKETGTPRAQVDTSLNYLTNQRTRMNYAEYRRQGLPITSSPMESAIKQINRRIKGSEKFWATGADPMLHLIADRLSQTNVVEKFWDRRLQRLIDSASYHPCQQAA